MKSIYISGPYTDPDPARVKGNIARAALKAADYIRQGYAVFCPHTMTEKIDDLFNTSEQITYDDWLTLDLYWLAKCDAIHMLPGWRMSKGAQVEHMVARALGLEILGAKQ